MKTWDYLQSWDTAQILVYGSLAGLAVVLLCAVLSVLVVLKRLAFVGQGVSHSAFGGIGVAAVLGAATGSAWLSQGSVGEFVVVTIFCVAAALGMAAVSDRKSVKVDTGIGLFLVGSMALGAILVQFAGTVARWAGTSPPQRSWESILFGSVLSAGVSDVIVAWGVLVLSMGVLWWIRRPMLFWAFDEQSAPAFGVRGTGLRLTMMVLLAVATVTAMKLCGVVLATALLVLPGATALKISARLWVVVSVACAVGVVGLVGGLVASVETDLGPGPCVVMVLAVVFGGAMLVGRRGGEQRRGRTVSRPIMERSGV